MARDPDEYDALSGAGKGAATGAAVGGPLGALIGGVAGAATPFLTKALGGLFGVDDAEDAEKAALSSLRRVADGGTTQGQAGMAYARGRSLQDLQGLANRGTAQQRAGLQRQAMQQAPGVQAQYASQLADLRSREQEHAASNLALYEGKRAAAEAARKRAALSGAIESGVTMGTKLGMAAGSPDPNSFESRANAYNKANTKYFDQFGGSDVPLGAPSSTSTSDTDNLKKTRVATLPQETTPAAPSPVAQPYQLDFGQQAGATPYQPVVPMLTGALTQPTMIQPSPAAQARMSDPFSNLAPAANLFQKATPSAFAQKQIKALKIDPYAVVRNQTPGVDFGNYGTAFIDDAGEAKVPIFKSRKNNVGGIGL